MPDAATLGELTGAGPDDPRPAFAGDMPGPGERRRRRQSARGEGCLGADSTMVRQALTAGFTGGLKVGALIIAVNSSWLSPSSFHDAYEALAATTSSIQRAPGQGDGGRGVPPTLRHSAIRFRARVRRLSFRV
jgi:hypothetical protein